MPSIKATDTNSFTQENSSYLAPGAPFPLFGREIDGDVTISGTKNINTERIGSNTPISRAVDAAVANVSAISGLTLSLTGFLAPGSIADLQPGDCCLLLNLQGTVANNANVGNFEYVVLDSVGLTTVTLKSAVTKLYGDTDNSSIGSQKVILMRVPEYRVLSVPTGTTLTCSAWNGSLGGVLALFAKEINCTGTGKLDVSGKGFRGATVDGGTGEGEQGGWNTVQTANIGAGAGGSTTLVSGTGGAAVGVPNLSKVFMGGGGGAGVTGDTASSGTPGTPGSTGVLGGTGGTGGTGGNGGAGSGGGGGAAGALYGLDDSGPTQVNVLVTGGTGGTVPTGTQAGGAGGPVVSALPGNALRPGTITYAGGAGGNGGSALPGAAYTGGAGGSGGAGGAGGSGSSGGVGGAGGARGTSGNGGGIIITSIKTGTAFSSSILGAAGAAGSLGSTGVAALSGDTGADGTAGSAGTAGLVAPTTRNNGLAGSSPSPLMWGFGSTRHTIVGMPGGGGGGGSSGTAGSGGTGGTGGRGGQGGRGGVGGTGGAGGQGSSGGGGAAGQAILNFYSIAGPSAVVVDGVSTIASPVPANGGAGSPVSNSPVPRPPYIPAPQPAPSNGDGWPGSAGAAGAAGAAGLAGFAGGGGGGGWCGAGVHSNNPSAGPTFPNFVPNTYAAGGGGSGGTTAAGSGGAGSSIPGPAQEPTLYTPGPRAVNIWLSGGAGSPGGNGGGGVYISNVFVPTPGPTFGNYYTWNPGGGGVNPGASAGGGQCLTSTPAIPTQHAPGGGGGAGGVGGSAGAAGTGGPGGSAGTGGAAGSNGSPGAGGAAGLRGAGGGSRNSGSSPSAASEGRIRVTYFIRGGDYASETADGDGLYVDTTIPGWKGSL